MKNEYEIRGDTIAIIINSPKHGRLEALIDTDNLALVDKFPNSWYAKYDKATRSFYVHGHVSGARSNDKKEMLHRLITNAPSGMVVDHINHNTLDNRRENLRVVSSAQNQQNRSIHKKSKSGIRGVTWSHKSQKWQAKIKVNNKVRHLGAFETVEEAAVAVKKGRAKYMPYSQEAL
jgi:hypothetical protein